MPGAGLRSLRLAALWVIALGSIAISFASAVYFHGNELPPFLLEKLPLARQDLWLLAVRVHVVAAAIALPGCLSLLSKTLLRRAPRLHRWLGRVIGAIVLLALAPTGFYLSLFAKGGLPSTLGFVLSGAIVVVATLLGVRAARTGSYLQHRRFMSHVLAQLSVAVTSRMMLFFLAAIDADELSSYVASLWLPVLASAAVIELLARRATSPSSLQTLDSEALHPAASHAYSAQVSEEACAYPPELAPAAGEDTTANTSPASQEMVNLQAVQAVFAAVPVPPQVARQIEMEDGDRVLEVVTVFDGAVQEVRYLDADAGEKYGLVIPDAAPLWLNHQGCSFLIRSVPRPRRHPVPLQIDWRAQSYIGAVSAGALVLLALLFSVPPEPRSLALDSVASQQLIRFIVTAAELTSETPDSLRKPKPRDKKAENRRQPLWNWLTQRNPRTLQDHQPASIRTASAIVGRFSRDVSFDRSRRPLDEIEADPGLPPSEDAQTRYRMVGRIFQARQRDYTGNLLGSILGRDDDDYQSSSGARGSGLSLSSYRAKIRSLQVLLGTPEIRGLIKKEQVRRIVRRHINEVKFCYERELVRSVHLQGRVMVQFVIATSGNVMASIVQSSTLANASTEQCIAGAVRRWEFPRQRNHIAVVSFPFVLKSGRDD